MATKNTLIHVRATADFKKKFVKKAKQYGSVSDVHRELLEAFVEGRMTITKPPHKDSIYVD